MKVIHFYLFVFIPFVFISCGENMGSSNNKNKAEFKKGTGLELIVLGIAQDAGYPQLACSKSCCKDLWNDPSARKMVSCLGIINHDTKESFLFDATPDIKFQLSKMNNQLVVAENKTPDGIFLTHAHIGHYTGLMHLGREAAGTKSVPVYAMPKMCDFLSENGPWSQLVSLENIKLSPLKANSTFKINSAFDVVPLIVPHRDEYSETVGFKIETKNKKVLFIPDIDKWQKWGRSIIEEIKNVDLAFLDGTFYKNGEIPGRDMSLIPHPFIEESITFFESLSIEDKAKVYFIHFNHTNPVLMDGQERRFVRNLGFNIAEEGMRFGL